MGLSPQGHSCGIFEEPGRNFYRMKSPLSIIRLEASPQRNSIIETILYLSVFSDAARGFTAATISRK